MCFVFLFYNFFLRLFFCFSACFFCLHFFLQSVFFLAGGSLFSASFFFWQGVVHLCDWCFCFCKVFFHRGALFATCFFSMDFCVGSFKSFFLPVFLQWFVFVSFCCKVVCVCLFFAMFFCFLFCRCFFLRWV